MRNRNIILLTFISFLLSVSSIFPQVFNLDDYKAFLEQHQNMNSDDLLMMYPAGNFLNNISQNYDDALYFDSIDTYYNLTDDEKSLLYANGFLVSERLSKVSFGQSILEIFHNDMPVFVSTDAILHAFHISYDRILQDMEIAVLEPKLRILLNSLRSSLPQLHNRYSSNPEMMTMLKDVDVYLTVPLMLLDEVSAPYYTENTALVNQVLSWIAAEQPDQNILFSSTCRIYEWSQFKPRGHYVYDPNNLNSVNQEPYFKAMMWFGRVELYLNPPVSLPHICPPQTFEDIQRQIIDAMLIDELFDIVAGNQFHEDIEGVLKFFIGESDNVTLINLDYLKQAVSLDSASQLLDDSKVIEFRDTLSNQAFAQQLILSQILFSNPMDPDSIIPASSFLLFGQRFVIDSYVTATVVYDRIKYMGNTICRLYPSTLDVLFSLGNNAAGKLLIEELDDFHYSTNLAALRYLIDNYDPAFWGSSIYNGWLGSLRTLNPPEDRSNLPDFMQTTAFWQQKMNTQLASWTQLRHDNLLYAKQSYTGGSICSYPFSFVEPFPEFYEGLKTLCNDASVYFNNLTFDPPNLRTQIINHFDHFSAVADTLQTISEKELSGTPFNLDEVAFLQNMLYETGASGEAFDGWYPHLYYDDIHQGIIGYEGLMDSDHIVADIHTTPTDCGGGPLGAISHVGTGPINLGVVITENYLGDMTAFVGPVLSYFEYRTLNFLRLNDDEWASTYLQSATRPDWVNIYLADSLGNFRGLITANEDDEMIIPESEIIIGNYPNPFNPSTIINFTIPRDLTNSNVKLNIYNINGELVKTLVDDKLSSGNYLVKWFADNNAGEKVSSGIYLYRLYVGDRVKTGKMNFVK